MSKNNESKNATCAVLLILIAFYTSSITCMFSLTSVTTQVQAAIKKNMEKQRRRSSVQGGGAGDAQSATPQPQVRQKSRQLPQRVAAEAAEAAEDSETLEEKLEEMMEGPQKRDRQKEKDAEPVDLLPIVDSVFGQVGLEIRVCLCIVACMTV